MLSAGLILFLAALQGVTELFPVSSLGHAVVVPPLVGLNFRETDPAFVPVLTVLHLGTAGALLFLYRRDWARIIAGFFRAAVRGRIDDPDLEVDATSILVLQNAGPVGYPGMPEVGNLALPRKLLDRGITDMVRISDGRMSGTAYGTVVLHVAPESAAGGPLSRLRTGDPVVLDVAGRRLDVDLPEGEWAARPPSATAAEAYAAPTRGWEKLYVDHVLQADRGVDLDFLVGRSGDRVSRDAIAALFETESNPITLIKQKELLEILESAIDRCEDVANVLETVVIKNA